MFRYCAALLFVIVNVLDAHKCDGTAVQSASVRSTVDIVHNVDAGQAAALRWFATRKTTGETKSHTGASRAVAWAGVATHWSHTPRSTQVSCSTGMHRRMRCPATQLLHLLTEWQHKGPHNSETTTTRHKQECIAYCAHVCACACVCVPCAVVSVARGVAGQVLHSQKFALITNKQSQRF